MKENKKLPFRKGSALNNLYLLRLKKEMTQEEVASIVGCTDGTFSNYENAIHYMPDMIAAQIPFALSLTAGETKNFIKFLNAVLRQRKNRRGKGNWNKDHAPVKIRKKRKKVTRKKVKAMKKIKKVQKKPAVFSSNKFIDGFLQKRGGKEALNWLLRVWKVARK